MAAPINVTWDGESFTPANRFMARKCDERFVVGQSYTLDEVHERTRQTHAHYFAALHEIWQSLPDHMAEQFPTEEKLRKYALIKCGFHTMTQHVCQSSAEAQRLAAAIRPYDDYQLVVAKDNIVTVYNALSQDMRHMDKKAFQESKEAVLDWCSGLIGTQRGRAA